MTGSILLRPLEPADQALSYAVYAGTRAEEMALVDWSAEQRDAFVRMQFDAQRQFYASQYPFATYQVIVKDGSEVGRLIVDRSGEEILLVDLALLPEGRGAGTGTALLIALQEEAARAGKPVRLHVEFYNPALRLYQQLGFTVRGSTGLHLELEWRPGADAGLSPAGTAEAGVSRE